MLSYDGDILIDLYVGVSVAPDFLRDRDIAEDRGALEAGQLPKAWTRARKEKRSHHRASSAKGMPLDRTE